MEDYEISVQELSKRDADSYILIDIRDDSSYSYGNIPGSLHVPKDILEADYEKYKDKGFVILGFPCNQFGSQEPGTEAEIKNFCEVTFSVSFPMMSKIDVNGENTHPLYKFLKSEQHGLLGNDIKWNFTKFLIDREGNVVERFASQKTPKGLEKEIEKLL